MRKVFHCDLCIGLNFNSATNRYKHKSKYVQETHKIIWYFEIKTDHIILGRKPVLILINLKKKKKKGKEMKTRRLVYFTVLAEDIVKIKVSGKIDKYLKFMKEEWRVTIMPFVVGALGTVFK